MGTGNANAQRAVDSSATEQVHRRGIVVADGESAHGATRAAASGRLVGGVAADRKQGQSRGPIGRDE
jgi:hypothetical protein